MLSGQDEMLSQMLSHLVSQMLSHLVSQMLSHLVSLSDITYR